MRLWHKDLIPVLPQKHLIAQWRELCAIAKNIYTSGTPNHVLVNPIVDHYEIEYKTYCGLVMDEMNKRGYSLNKMSMDNLMFNINNSSKHFKKYRLADKYAQTVKYDDLYKDWMNDRYLLQCFMNLQEKYDRGMFDISDYKKIYKLVSKKLGKNFVLER